MNTRASPSRFAGDDSLRHVVLVGPMGAGKTALGRALAEVMQRPFLDSDRLIENAYGRNARQLAADEGVPELHRIELAVFRSAIETPQASVIAAAASVADSPTTLAATAATHTLCISMIRRTRRARTTLLPSIADRWPPRRH